VINPFYLLTDTSSEKRAVSHGDSPAVMKLVPVYFVLQLYNENVFNILVTDYCTPPPERDIMQLRVKLGDSSASGKFTRVKALDVYMMRSRVRRKTASDWDWDRRMDVQRPASVDKADTQACQLAAESSTFHARSCKHHVVNHRLVAVITVPPCISVYRCLRTCLQHLVLRVITSCEHHQHGNRISEE